MLENLQLLLSDCRLALWQDPKLRQAGLADLDMLQLAAAAGEICLKYLDESGLCLWSPVSYTWAKQGVQKRMEQTQRRGRRLSIWGLMQPGLSFEYGLSDCSINSKSYIQLMGWEASKAEQRLTETGQITVIVQDHGSVHTCAQVRQLYP